MGKQVKVRGLFAPHGSQWTAEPTAFQRLLKKEKRGLSERTKLWKIKNRNMHTG